MTSPTIHNVDDRNESREDAVGYAGAMMFDTIPDSGNNSSMKRKSITPEENTEQPTSKRVKLEDSAAENSSRHEASSTDWSNKLPVEIWQRIFTMVPPKSLGRLLAVNKLFHVSLNPSPASAFALPCGTRASMLPLLKPDAIWQASRRLYWYRMPAPLKGKTELDMWRLACSTSCQMCGVPAEVQSYQHGEPDQRGPGAKGVSAVFPFVVTVCAACLLKGSTKEMEAVLSPSIPSPLLAGLPVVFLSDTLHVVPPQALQLGTLQPQTQLTKLFWTEHIKSIKAEFETVTTLGTAVAEEWVKGLDLRGKKLLVDASRWEKWSLAGGIQEMRTHIGQNQIPSKSSPLGIDSSSDALASRLAADEGREVSQVTQPATQAEISSSAQLEESTRSLRPDSEKRTTAELKQHRLAKRAETKSKKAARRAEAKELKVARRAEIERRAMLLDPPFTPDLLAQIPAFQASLHIANLLDDNAWELLKPRLLAHREHAESKNTERATHSPTEHEGHVEAHNESEAKNEPPKKVSDKDWDDAQGPVRGQISRFADEIIRNKWSNGKKIRQKSCTEFAVEVLLYVRSRFYAEVAQQAAAALAAGKPPVADPPEGPWTQKLTLENMKWVFNLKVNPFTKVHHDKIFYCNGCPNNTKQFMLDAVIQHYATKHTADLSQGNSVVHWRSEWPEVPLFRSEKQTPVNTKNSGKQEKIRPNPDQSQSKFAELATPNNMFQASAQLSFPTDVMLQPAIDASLAELAETSLRGEASTPSTGPLNYTWPSTEAADPADTVQETSKTTNEASSNLAARDVAAYQASPSHQEPKTESAKVDGSLGRLQRLNRDIRKQLIHVSHMLGSSKRVPVPFRVFMIIHHVAKLLRSDNSKTSALDTIIDGFFSLKLTRDIRQTTNLRCKACQASKGAKKEFSLLPLLDHFRKVHVQGPSSTGGRPRDWCKDMILLPSTEELGALRDYMKKRAPRAYKLAAEALPEIFTDDQFPLGLEKHPRQEYEPHEPHTSQGGDGGSQQSSLEVDLSELQRMPSPFLDAGSDPKPTWDQHKTRPEPATSQHLHMAFTQDIPLLRPASEVYGSSESQKKKKKHSKHQQAARTKGSQHNPTPPSVNPPRQEFNVASAAFKETQYSKRRGRSTGSNRRARENQWTHEPAQGSRWEEPRMSRGRAEGHMVSPAITGSSMTAFSDDLYQGAEEIICMDASGRELRRVIRQPVGYSQGLRPAYHEPDAYQGPSMPPSSSHFPVPYDGVASHYVSHDARSRQYDREWAPSGSYRRDPVPSQDRGYGPLEFDDLREDSYYIRRPDQFQSSAHYYGQEPSRSGPPSQSSSHNPFYPTTSQPAPHPLGYARHPQTRLADHYAPITEESRTQTGYNEYGRHGARRMAPNGRHTAARDAQE